MARAASTAQPPRLALAARDIKIAHSVFAMPFAILGAFLAREPEAPPARFAGQLALVVVCMVAARTFAMLVNRLADRELDARNPRTAGRAFASGALSVRFGYILLAGSGGLFVVAACGFGFAFGNWWPGLLAAPVLAWIAFYSFTKRFTWLCHVMLGGALAASPLAAGIAVRPQYLADSATLLWLAGMVACWVAGFDIIYALQDLDFDRGHRLHSVPARFGAAGALWISRGLHAVALAALLAAWASDGRLGALTAAAVAAVAALLVAEHAVLVRRGRAGLNLAFFTLNGVVSCVLGLAGSIDTLL
jgi:4-hydroxybenzoate polyprenyltransferase